MAVRTHRALASLQRTIAEACHEPKLAASSAEEPEQAWSRRPPPEAWQRNLSTIKDNLFEVINPPSALGSGCRGLAHKCGNIAFAWHLQTDKATNLQDVADSYASHTSDMGVEISMPEFQIADPDSILPDWLHRRSQSDEGEANADNEGIDSVDLNSDASRVDGASLTPVEDPDELWPHGSPS